MTTTKCTSVAFALLATVAACGGGAAPGGVSSTAPRDPPPNDRDMFVGRDDPGTPRDVPPNDRDGVSGATGGSATCPACDATYACSVVDGGSTVHFALLLETTEKGCELVDQDAVITCDGRITPTGQGLALTWQAYGSGGFTANSLKGSITCIPAQTTAPGPQPGGNGDDDSSSGSSNGSGSN